jgi:hypothetical protein
MTDTAMNCEQLDAALEGYLEGDLDLRTRTLVERHAGECFRCAALVRDLEAIRRDAAQLPVLEPSRDLWEGIASRIEAPVIPLTRKEKGRPDFGRFMRVGVAASILVAATAGLTYVLTMRHAELRVPSLAVIPEGERVVRQGDSPQPGERARSAIDSPAPAPAPAPTSLALRTRNSALPAPVANIPAVVTYDDAIAQLRGVVELRRADLNPATVAVVENSLATIDRAIAEARAALTRDSASAFLQEQLNKALEKKLGLLRTVALLPPRA